jgi:hypothetical protein
MNLGHTGNVFQNCLALYEREFAFSVRIELPINGVYLQAEVFSVLEGSEVSGYWIQHSRDSLFGKQSLFSRSTFAKNSSSKTATTTFRRRTLAIRMKLTKKRAIMGSVRSMLHAS